MTDFINKEPVQRVNQKLKEFDQKLQIVVLENTAKTAADAANSLGTEIGSIVKSLLFKCENNYFLCLVAGDKRCSLNKIKKDNKTKIPLILKISPDIKDNYISEIVNVAINCKISAIILTNTTNGNRSNLISEIKKEKGGLSGEPLQKISTNMIKKIYKLLNGKIPIIGVGGVKSGK